jgi:hypothetical protein
MWTIGICGCAIPKSGCQPVDLPSRCENCGGEIPALRSAATRETRGTPQLSREEFDATLTLWLDTYFYDHAINFAHRIDDDQRLDDLCFDLLKAFAASQPVAPPPRCEFCGENCQASIAGPMIHHFFKYHFNPEDEQFYFGDECVNCEFSLAFKRFAEWKARESAAPAGTQPAQEEK